MFEGLKLKRERIELERQRISMIREALTSYGSDRLKKSFEDPDEASWTALGTAGVRELSTGDQQTMREQAHKLYYTNPHARNIIRLMEKYTVGRGFSISHTTNVEPVALWWDEFWKRNRMVLRKKEIVRRGMRDGEVFLRCFLDTDGMLILRFLNPAKIKAPDQPAEQPKGDTSHGVETDREDVEKVLAYWYDGKRIPADEVIARKILVDSDVKRGRSFLEIGMRYMAMFNKWLTDRMKLNYIRSLIGLVRKVKGGSADVANLAAGYETTQLSTPSGTAKMRMPEGVSVMTVNEGVDYEFKTPNLQASDVQADGRQVLLAIAAGAGMPEFMVSADASSSNYASTLVAEAPGVMEFQDWQDFWSDIFQEIYARAIEAGIAARKIPQFYDDIERVDAEEEQEKVNPITGERTLEKVKTKVEKKVRKPIPRECDIEFPEIVHREFLQETQALVLQLQQDIISKHTMAARLNLNYDDERERIEQEREEEGEETGEDTGADREYDRGRQDEIARQTQDKLGENPENLPETK